MNYTYTDKKLEFSPEVQAVIDEVVPRLCSRDDRENTRTGAEFDGKTPFIACHGVSLEKACEFVFGPASYSVKVGAGRNENGRILEVERLTHEDTKKVIRKIAGVRANSENLRTPQFTNI